MATYKSAKKQLAWTMEVLEGELEQVDSMCNTYCALLENAQNRENEEDIDFWFNALDLEVMKRQALESVYFMITHPDIHDENWK